MSEIISLIWFGVTSFCSMFDTYPIDSQHVYLMETLPTEVLFYEIVSRLSVSAFYSLCLINKVSHRLLNRPELWNSVMDSTPYHELQETVLRMVKEGMTALLFIPSITERIDKRVLARIGYWLLERGNIKQSEHVRRRLQVLYHDPCGLNRYDPIVVLLDQIVDMFNSAPKDFTETYWLDRKDRLPTALWDRARMIGMPVFYGAEYIATRVKVENWCMNADRPILELNGKYHYITDLHESRAISRYYCLNMGLNFEIERLHKNGGRVSPYLIENIHWTFSNVLYTRASWLRRFHKLRFRKVIVSACTVLEPEEWHREIMSDRFSDSIRSVYLVESLNYSRKNGYTEWRRRAELLMGK